MASAKVLLVDDDPNLVELIGLRLEAAGYEVLRAFDEGEAMRKVRETAIDLSVVDLQLVQRDGISLMESLHQVAPRMPVIILTAHGSIESAVEAMKKGAYSYLTKPFESRDLIFQIERAIDTSRLSIEVDRLRDLLQERYSPANIVAGSEKMRNVLEAVSRIADTESTVLLLGESGTGKDLIAKLIHLAGPRKAKPFVALNCAALPETLLESSLFGHERGAFSGAVKTSRGLFQQAHGGSVFLDEIADMPLAIQAKVLRVLQEKQFYPLGSEKLIEVDVRVITATNKNLEEQVKLGLFRQDLYYRIHVIPILLPPLRERKEDIPPLIDHFIQQFSMKTGKEIKGLTPQAMQKLMLYDWPGNVRELENTLEYAVTMADTDRITEDLVLSNRVSVPPDKLLPLREAKDAFEKSYLTSLLQTCRGNVSEASKLAGKYRADFYILLRKHHLSPSTFKD